MEISAKMVPPYHADLRKRDKIIAKKGPTRTYFIADVCHPANSTNNYDVKVAKSTKTWRVWCGRRVFVVILMSKDLRKHLNRFMVPT